MNETYEQAIERLKSKKNAKPFGLHEEGDKETFEKIGRANCKLFCNDGSWYVTDSCSFETELTYVIRESYQLEPPGPEYVDCEIETDADGLFLGIYKKEGLALPHGFTHLHCLPSLPSFRGFYYMGPLTLCITDVAEKYAKGKAIVARFEKEKP